MTIMVKKPTKKDRVIELARLIHGEFTKGDIIGAWKSRYEDELDESYLGNLLPQLSKDEEAPILKYAHGWYIHSDNATSEDIETARRLRQKDEEEAPNQLTAAQREGEIPVRHFGKTGAGPGRTPDLQVQHEVRLTENEYRLIFGNRSPEEVGFFEVDGDSAAPEYFHGEDVPVEVVGNGEQRFRDDGKYVYRYRDDAQLKRLRRIEKNKIEARSLNPGITLQILKPDEHEFEILGRVIETPKQQLYGALIGRFLRMGNGEELPI